MIVKRELSATSSRKDTSHEPRAKAIDHLNRTLKYLSEHWTR
jgi:hypothetical protein